jgi:hypothetical protein
MPVFSFSLPFVCCEIYSETIAYLYSLTNFTFLRCRYLGASVGTCRDDWVVLRTEERLRWVRSIIAETEAVVDEVYSGRVQSHSNVFPNLREVLVNQAYVTKRHFRDMRRSEAVKVVKMSTRDEVGGDDHGRW